MDIPAITAAISSATSIVKELRSIDKGIGEAEFKLKIAELTESVADMKIAIIELREEGNYKDRRIEELMKFDDDKEKLIYHKGYYYPDGGDGRPAGLPYCSVCMLEGKLVLITKIIGGLTDLCPKCKGVFDVDRFAWPVK